MNLILAMNSLNVIQSKFFNISTPSIPGYQHDIIEETSKTKVAFNELKKDIGDNLFYSLSEADKQFILATEGSIDLGYKASKTDLKRIFSSIKNDYQY